MILNPFDDLCADLSRLYKEKLSYDDGEAYRSAGFTDKAISPSWIKNQIKLYVDDYEADRDSDSLGELSISDKSYKLMDNTVVSMVCATYESQSFFASMSVLITNSSNSYISVDDRCTIDVRTVLELL